MDVFLYLRLTLFYKKTLQVYELSNKEDSSQYRPVGTYNTTLPDAFHHLLPNATDFTAKRPRKFLYAKKGKEYHTP